MPCAWVWPSCKTRRDGRCRHLERDRLVQALNHMKPDKKTHLQVQGVPLDATTANEADEEAATKKCAYVVYTTLTELRNADDPYQHVPGTIETNPNSPVESAK